MASLVISDDYFNFGWIFDMKINAIDDNHFVVSVNTDSQIVFNMLVDKDYPTRLRRMKLRKYGTFEGSKMDIFKSITALKV